MRTPHPAAAVARARSRAGLTLLTCLLLSGAPATAAALLPVGVQWTTSRACVIRMESTEHAHLDSFVSAARTAGIAAAIFFCVRSFLVEPYFIPSSSMAPTLYANDHIAVEKFSKYLSPPHRGDMLVFVPPAAFFEDDGKAEADDPVVLVKPACSSEACGHPPLRSPPACSGLTCGPERIAPPPQRGGREEAAPAL